MKKPQLPTLEDVAKKARVSTATISRCLNSPDQVAVHTRSRVMEAVKSLGYSPNFGAKALASRRTNTVGAIIPTMANAIFASGLQAFQQELTEHGATLLVASSYYDPVIEEQQIRAMIARGADGLLLIGKVRDKQIYQFLEQHNIPFVIAWSFGRQTNRSFVGFDNGAAAFALAERAIELGHRHFAFLSAERKYNDRARDRVTGVKRALKKHGIDPASMLIEEVPYSIREAGAAFKSVIQKQRKTTIVMCGNDVQAVGSVKQARALGLAVPGDISITGFDDLELATVVEPAITTVHVPHREMGKLAAEVLISRMIGGSEHKRIKLPTYIVERDTLGRCPNQILYP